MSVMMQIAFGLEEKTSKIVHALSTSKVSGGLLGDLSAWRGNYSSFLLIDIFTGHCCSVHQSWEGESPAGAARSQPALGNCPLLLLRISVSSSFSL